MAYFVKIVLAAAFLGGGSKNTVVIIDMNPPAYNAHLLNVLQQLARWVSASESTLIVALNPTILLGIKGAAEPYIQALYSQFHVINLD